MTSAKDAPTVFIVEDEDAFIEALDIGSSVKDSGSKLRVMVRRRCSTSRA